MALTNKVIGAGLKDASVRVALGTTYDIYGIVEANGSAEVNETEIKGDDVILGTFVSGQKETLTLKANAISFDTLQAITGNTYSSSSAGGEIALGTEAEQNTPFVEVTAYTTAKDSGGTKVTIEKIWHKAQVKNTKVSQAGEQEFNVEIELVAIPTALDIVGGALTPSRIATLKFYS